MEVSGYISKTAKGGLQIHADQAFVEIYPSVQENNNIDQISKRVKERVVQEARKYFEKEPSSGSLNNCSGRWHELAFLMAAHKSIIENTDHLYIVRMGSESSIKFWEIYTEGSLKEFKKFMMGLQKKNMTLRCSTPDFVIIDRSILRSTIVEDISNLSAGTINLMLKLYEDIKGQCDPSQVKSFISLKSSNRPDRRYQILYEANITKYAGKYIHGAQNPLRFDVVGQSNREDSDVFKAPKLSALPAALTFKSSDINDASRLIDSDERIETTTDLDSYWSRFC